ncbi:MAG: ribosome recycling factor [Lentisphaerae bacterium]|nr:ribosome recycling factor [Lentisphaerota bacterium]MCP4102917.1 ribosome recycling factor [Lentisphaerota bacterium]
MSVEIELLMDYLEENMMKCEEAMKRDFAAVRTGKASPALVEGIMIDYYGTATRLKELAGITVPEPRMLVIQPWDTSSISVIEKTLIASDLGISPVNDGRVLRLPVPELSEERRNSLVKKVKNRSEESKIAIRNIRREGNDIAKKAEKGSKITEDDLKDMLEDIQKLTDKFIKNIEKDLVQKEDDLMSV